MCMQACPSIPYTERTQGKRSRTSPANSKSVPQCPPGSTSLDHGDTRQQFARQRAKSKIQIHMWLSRMTLRLFSSRNVGRASLLGSLQHSELNSSSCSRRCFLMSVRSESRLHSGSQLGEMRVEAGGDGLQARLPLLGPAGARRAAVLQADHGRCTPTPFS